MGFWNDKRVLVTGGAGFLGSVVVEKIRARGCPHIFVPRSHEFNLLAREAVIRLLRTIRPDIILHLAAVVGGIGANRKHPGRFFYENALMGIQLIEESCRLGVGKFVCVGTICSYPKLAPIPFHEEELWNGYPEETNAPYGLAKKMLLVQLQAYRQEYGFNGIYLLPVNLYGPGDNFDLENSHVIPALIRKMVEAKLHGERKVVAWGTGNISREFLYVEDAAEGILMATEHYNKPDPVNIGTGQEITIRELVHLIQELTNYDGEILWDNHQPDGQPRRCLDTKRANMEFGFVASTGLREGLQKTIRWYESQTFNPAVKVGHKMGMDRDTPRSLPLSISKKVSDEPLQRGPADPKLGGISLVFPVYNESFIIEQTLRNYVAELERRVEDLEVIVAEDGSTDDTKGVLERLQNELPIKLFMSDERKGYQKAIRDAISHATKTWLFIVDSDYQFAAVDFWRLEPHRLTHDIILGTKSPRKDPFYRIFLSWGYNFLMRRFFHVPYRDMDTGFRLVRRTVANEIAPDVKHMWFFTAEFVVRAHYAGYKILEVPVPHYTRKIGSTTIFYVSKLLWICVGQFVGILRMRREFKQKGLMGNTVQNIS